jgi:FK506-binding nuclear protein
LYSRFEEIKDDEPAKNQKRVRESDGADAKDSGENKNKKLKADGGKAVTVDAAPIEEQKEKKNKKKKKAKEKAAKTAAEGAEKEEIKPSTEKTIVGGIVIEDAKTGTGPQAKKGSTVRMRYIGKLTNGKVFDKNTTGKPVSYHPSFCPQNSKPLFSSLSIWGEARLLKAGTKVSSECRLEERGN